jgi:hypothetical protein
LGESSICFLPTCPVNLGFRVQEILGNDREKTVHMVQSQVTWVLSEEEGSGREENDEVVG